MPGRSFRAGPSPAGRSVPTTAGESLLAYVVGDRALDGEKGACRIARLLEERLIAQGWPQGSCYGSEQALAGAFGVGRAVIREAVKILEVRGTAKMVRGRGGGLRILAIDARQAANLAVAFGLVTGVTDDGLIEAADVLDRVRGSVLSPSDGHTGESSGTTAVLDFCDLIISTLRQMLADGDGGALHPSILLAPEALRCSRAGQVAALMLRECSAEQWLRGHRLGSEEELCSRYNVYRGTFRQAVRILESIGAAEANCGRGHGLMSQSPRAGGVARMVSCFFASSSVHPRDVLRVFHRLKIETIGLAAGKAMPERCDTVRRAFERLEGALERHDSADALDGVFKVEEAITSATANPALELLVHSLGGYPAARIPRNADSLEATNRSYLSLSRPILRALRAGNPESAIAAEEARAEGLSSLSSKVLELAH